MTRSIVQTLFFLFTLGTLVACGGGSGGDGGSALPPPGGGDDGSSGDGSPPATGSFTLLVTDAETDRFNEILITINEAILIPADETLEPQTVLEGTLTIDLRALTDFSEFLAEAEVDTGEYAKLRLIVDDIELNEIDDNGNLVDTRIARVPSGRIDLNPRGAFTIEGGEDEIVLIDFDADNSFRLIETGSGRIVFRPVVLVTVLGEGGNGDGDNPGRFVRLHGQITQPDPENSTFELCGLDMMSAGNSDAVRPDKCATVTFEPATSVFSDEFEPGSGDDLVENAKVTAFGRMSRGDDGFIVRAVLLALGESERLQSVKGQVASAPESATFGFKPNRPEALDVNQTVRLLEGALVFDRDEGETLESDELEPGTRVTIIGASGETENTFDAIAVAVADDDDESEIEGIVASVTGSEITVTVDEDGVTADRCVLVGDATAIQVSRGGRDGREVLEGELSDIRVDAEIEATGTADDAGCLVAELVIVDEVDDDDEDE